MPVEVVACSSRTRQALCYSCTSFSGGAGLEGRGLHLPDFSSCWAWSLRQSDLCCSDPETRHQSVGFPRVGAALSSHRLRKAEYRKYQPETRPLQKHWKADDSESREKQMRFLLADIAAVVEAGPAADNSRRFACSLEDEAKSHQLCESACQGGQILTILLLELSRVRIRRRRAPRSIWRGCRRSIGRRSVATRPRST